MRPFVFLSSINPVALVFAFTWLRPSPTAYTGTFRRGELVLIPDHGSEGQFYDSKPYLDPVDDHDSYLGGPSRVLVGGSASFVEARTRAFPPCL